MSIPNPNPHPITDKGPIPVANQSSFAPFTILAEIPTIFSQFIAAVELFLAHRTIRAVRTALPTARPPDCSDHAPLPIPVTRSNAWACLVAVIPRSFFSSVLQMRLHLSEAHFPGIISVQHTKRV